MINIFSSQLITLQEKARYILSEADSNERMLHWIQEMYPNATISDAKRERALMQKLIDANTNVAGQKAMNELSVFHQSLASRSIKHSDR